MKNKLWMGFLVIAFLMTPTLVRANENVETTSTGEPDGFWADFGENEELYKERREELKKLREENPEAFKAKLKEYRQEARERLKKLHDEDPEKFKEVMQKRKERHDERMQNLKEKDPAKYEALMQKKTEMREKRREEFKNNPEKMKEWKEKFPWKDKDFDGKHPGGQHGPDGPKGPDGQKGPHGPHDHKGHKHE